MKHKTAAFILASFVVGIFVAAIITAQQPTPSPTPKPCENNARVFVLSPSELEAKVKELSQEGYCVKLRHLRVVDDKVILLVEDSDRMADEYEEEEQ